MLLEKLLAAFLASFYQQEALGEDFQALLLKLHEHLKMH